MYELKTLLPEFEIKLPTTMYAMKNQSLSRHADPSMNDDEYSPDGKFTAKLSTKTANTTKTTTPTITTTAKKADCALDLDILGAQIQQTLKSSMDLSIITDRQEEVMKQLHDFQVKLNEVRFAWGVFQEKKQQATGQTASGTGNKSAQIEEPLQDIVINGHPNFIPYALLALKNAWHDSFHIDVEIFTHSTMADIGPEAREFETKLKQSSAQATKSTNKPKIKVTLIWKNCEHTEMISSPTMYVPIYGEVNIIRYLGRIGPAAYRYENSMLCNEIDLVLDICYQLLRCNTPKGIAGMLRALDERLGEQQYFGGHSMSVADIGVHSSLKRLPKIKDKDLTPKLLAWRKRAELITRI